MTNKSTSKQRKQPKPPCQHRSVAAWPDKPYGVCTACGASLERVVMGGVVLWRPLAARPVKRRVRRPVVTLVQPSLFG